MISSIRVPTISANIDEVTVTQWLKREGDPVDAGEPLVELTTDKATFEFESPVTGILRSVLAAENSVIPTDYIMAQIGPADEPVPDVVAENEALMQAHREKRGRGSRRVRRRRQDQAETTVRATPAARKLAREHDLDLAIVQQICAAGLVNREHVQQFLVQRNHDRPT